MRHEIEKNIKNLSIDQKLTLVKTKPKTFQERELDRSKKYRMFLYNFLRFHLSGGSINGQDDLNGIANWHWQEKGKCN